MNTENKNLEAYEDRLLGELEEKIMQFSYRKKDGTVRVSIGTRCKKYIPKYVNEEAVDYLINAVEHNLDSMKRMFYIGLDKTALQHNCDLLENCMKPLRPKEKKEESSESSFINYYDFEAKSFRRFEKGSLVAPYMYIGDNKVSN